MLEAAVPDPELTPEELRLVEALGGEDVEAIDTALLAAASQNWKKVAWVVGSAFLALADQFPGIPDVYFSQRVQALVRLGKLNSQGNLLCMRFSEVRLAAPEGSEP
jgi:hypothetical protein